MIVHANVELPTLTDNGSGMPNEDIQITLFDPKTTKHKTVLFSELPENEKAILVAYYNLLRNKLEDNTITVVIEQINKVISLKSSFIRLEGAKQDLPAGTVMPLVFESERNDFSGEKNTVVVNAKYGEVLTTEEITALQAVGLNIINGSTWTEMAWQTDLPTPVRLTVDLPNALGNKVIIIN